MNELSEAAAECPRPRNHDRSAASEASEATEEGVVATADYRIAAHNRFGWGDYSCVASVRVRPLKGMALTVAEDQVNCHLKTEGG